MSNLSTRILVIFIFFYWTIGNARSVHRITDPKTPTISVCWDKSPGRTYTLHDSHLSFHPIFSFDRSAFNKYLLPPDAISYTKNTKTYYLKTSIIDALIDKLLDEIRAKKKRFSDFRIIKKRNFSFKKQSGLLIVAFKKYPFVLKLFMETPKTFFDFYAKGIEPVCFFYMSGGANRHVVGLTRIENRQYLLDKAASLPDWQGCIEIPRKWFWLPKKSQWLDLEGKNIDDRPIVHNQIPATYGVIADLIDIEQKSTLSPEQESAMVLQLSKDLDLCVDAHRDNFVFTNQLTPQGKPKIIIVDTEHFPSIVGLKGPQSFNNYFDWLLLLIKKCFTACYLRPKSHWRSR